MKLIEIAKKLIEGVFHEGDKFISDEGFEFEFITQTEFTVRPPGQEATCWEASDDTLA